jgi:CheY-like chemotaxis protein
MGKGNILVVEDEAIVAMEIEEKLTSIGYDIAGVVSTGEEAVKKAGALRPDLILMDVRLEGAMDGIVAAGHIKEMYDIPIIYLTAYTDENTLERAKITEPLGYLVKPFSREDLRVSIDVALHRHMKEKQVKESSRWFSATLDVLGGAVIATNEKGIIVDMNSIAESLTGWTKGEAVGRELAVVYRLMSQESGELITDPLSMAHFKSDLVPACSRYILVSKSNIQTPVVSSVIAVGEVKGVVAGIIVAFQDVTRLSMPNEVWNSYAANLHLSGLLLGSQGHYERAESCLKRALFIWEGRLGREHPKVAKTLEALAGLYEQSGRQEEAAEIQARAAAIRAGVAPSTE